ncbi:MAG: hypothetical protein Mars2KO_21020 [Maribacter sp.]|uniref:hypothetical protein n=1 Tax=Maribacter sp. 2307UL18-2 TaxID=3386274 RepID=UPI0039BC48C1
MEFNLAEKLAIIRIIDSVIIVDDVIHEGEISLFKQLIHYIGFEDNFLFHAKNLDFQEALLMLKEMCPEKKKALGEILQEVSEADGFVHQKEILLIENIMSSIGV